MKKLPSTLPAFFWHFAKPYLFILIVIQVLCLSWSLDQTLWPWVIELLVDALSNFTGDRTLMWSALTVPLWFGAILWIGTEIANRVAGILMAKIFPSLEASVRKEMFEYVQHHSYTYFSDHLAGSLSNKISDIVQAITNIAKSVMTTFLPVFLAAIISSLLFLKLSPLFASILLGWIIIHLSICYAFSKGCDNAANIHSEARSELSGRIVDSLSNNITVKLFSRHKDESKLLNETQKDEQHKHQHALWYFEKMKLVLGVVSFLIPGVALNWLMLYSWQQGQITTGEVVFIFNSSWNIMGMVWLAGHQLPDLFKEIGRSKQALTIIQDAHDITDLPTSKPLHVAKGEIIFDHVTFNHNSTQTLFQDKTIKIEAGQKIGLVGFSGSGKSTFANLILRFYEPEKGRILVDGNDIAEVTQESLRKNIAMIPQDASLFHRTLFENIQYGRMDATIDEVIDASKKAYCHEFIEKLPDGYDTFVGERGTKLSGGQRQRIALARAILKNAPILIFDEATSALDSVTEKYIQEAFKLLMQGRTTIVIAHRLSTLSDMDRILVFNSGRIIEDGTHYDLIDAGGHYATMWAMQAEGFLPE
jgi:ATP-binding cassette, subfamily B, bacterial